jgi:hypothetical protein
MFVLGLNAFKPSNHRVDENVESELFRIGPHLLGLRDAQTTMRAGSRENLTPSSEQGTRLNVAFIAKSKTAVFRQSQVTLTICGLQPSPPLIM